MGRAQGLFEAWPGRRYPARWVANLTLAPLLLIFGVGLHASSFRRRSRDVALHLFSVAHGSKSDLLALIEGRVSQNNSALPFASFCARVGALMLTLRGGCLRHTQAFLWALFLGALSP